MSRRVVRRLLDVVGIIGLLCCVVLVAAWVRAEFVSDTLRRSTIAGDDVRWEERETTVVLSNGTVRFSTGMIATFAQVRRRPESPPGGWEWDRRPWKRWGPEESSILFDVRSEGTTETMPGGDGFPARSSLRVGVALWVLMVPFALAAVPAALARLRRRWPTLRVHWGGVARALPLAAVVAAAALWGASYVVGATWQRQTFVIGEAGDLRNQSAALGYGRFLAMDVQRRMALEREVIRVDRNDPIPTRQRDSHLSVRVGWPVQDPGRAGATLFQGYGYDQRQDKRRAGSATTAALRVPLWALPAALLPALAWPAWHFVRVRRAAARLRKGLCLRCGYDLCASGDRCPECGELIAGAGVRRSGDTVSMGN